MTATKLGSGGRLELWAEDPDELVIYAPKPAKGLSAYTFQMPMPTDDDPLAIVRVPVRTVAEHDGHDKANPDYDPTFDWRIDSDHVVNLVTMGAVMSGKSILARVVGEQKVVVDGRHSVVAHRIANQVLKAIGGAPLRIETRRRKITDDKARIVHLIGNKTYRRSPRAEAEQVQMLRDQNNLSLGEIARIMGCSESTVRNRLALLEGDQRPEKDKGPNVRPLQRDQIRKLAERICAKETPGINNSLVRELILFVATGQVPDDADPKIRAWAEGIV